MNMYFPLLIPSSFLQKEADHVEGFAKECAVVTHHRLANVTGSDGKVRLGPDPESKLGDPYVIRPTSETMIWSFFRKWISSHRDLPLLTNQWANVVRWELRTRPFLRTSEFLWQEGHTAHATEAEALGESRQMLDVYKTLIQKSLAIPVISGEKSVSERFAGAERTYTLEALACNGWALQTATSHFLGQNFSRAFDVHFRTASQTDEFAWGTSWGVSTRLVGAVILTHSDDAGFVAPPAVAHIQVVVIPLGRGSAALAAAREVASELSSKGVRAHVDSREDVKAGAKFFEWEKKGVPLRIEVGERELARGECRFVWRKHLGDDFVPTAAAASEVLDGLRRFNDALFSAAEAHLKKSTKRIQSFEELQKSIDGGGIFLAGWAENSVAEAEVKERTKATIRCYPLDEQADIPNLKCMYTGERATHVAAFARAF